MLITIIATLAYLGLAICGRVGLAAQPLGHRGFSREAMRPRAIESPNRLLRDQSPIGFRRDKRICPVGSAS
jgi:hypothetical protein